jgi:hypothetical protein
MGHAFEHKLTTYRTEVPVPEARKIHLIMIVLRQDIGGFSKVAAR